MKTITQNQVLKELEDGLKTQSRCVIVEYTADQVNYGFDAKPNFEYCQKHDIPCVNIGRRGGAFVVNKGDIGFGYIEQGCNNKIGEAIYDRFVQFFLNKGLNATQCSNDVLINGYKVFGWASHYYKDFDAIYITAHFTLSVDVELIKNVCTKEMNKVPKGLNDFGIIKQDVISFLEQIGEEYTI